jgi:hypothetical protein
MIKIASEDDSLLGYSFRLLQRCYTALYARRQSVIFVLVAVRTGHLVYTTSCRFHFSPTYLYKKDVRALSGKLKSSESYVIIAL